ncbi:hypothetical protein ACIBQ3_10275 [Streptomyces rubiginosohelvolus]|uniref:hypothetical protein n=1 Tax=Streptomyces rubiginosohelvolus TaxID=67362 RepID=UPI0037A5A40F
MGRHSLPDSHAAEGRRGHLSTRRRRRTVAVATLLVLAVATGTAAAAKGGLLSFSESCEDSAVHLSVVASPDIAPAVRSIAEALAAGDTEPGFQVWLGAALGPGAPRRVPRGPALHEPAGRPGGSGHVRRARLRAGDGSAKDSLVAAAGGREPQPYAEPAAEVPSGEELRETLGMWTITVQSARLTTGLYDTTLASYKEARSTYVKGKFNALVILTDGSNQDTDGTSRSGLITELKELVDPERPVPVIAIAAGPDADRDEVAEIARVTGGDGYEVSDPAEIQAVILQAIMAAGQGRPRRPGVTALTGRAAPRRSDGPRAGPVTPSRTSAPQGAGNPTGQVCTGSPACISSA